MATYSPKGKGHLTPKNNTVESFPFCRPDDYRNNGIPPKVYTAPNQMTSIWQHKIQAGIAHNDMHENMRQGGTPSFDMERHKIQHRWHEQYTKRGQSTFNRSQDGIVGA